MYGKKRITMNHDRIMHEKKITKCSITVSLSIGGTIYRPFSISSPGRYTRSQSVKLFSGAGSQLDSYPAGALFWI
jgi:hypothetical protein